MTKDQFRRMLDAARDIVRCATEGAAERGDIGDPTVQWAQDVLAMNPRKPCPSPVRDRMLKLWDDDLLKGWTAPAIAQEMDHPLKKVRELCALLGKQGLLFPLGTGRRGNRFTGSQTQYFVSEMAREQGRPAFQAQVQVQLLQSAVKVKPPKVPKPPKPPRQKPAPKPRRVNLARQPSTPFNPLDGAKARAPIETVLDSGNAFIPDHVKPQIIPTPPGKYHVDPPSDGFLAEFKRLTTVPRDPS